MAKVDILSQLYGPKQEEYHFNFNELMAPPLLSLITVTDIGDFNYLVTSPRYKSKIDFKHNTIKEKMALRGFKKLHAGTNRVVYINPDIPSVVLKICTKSVALTDAPNEYRNQFYLAPFVAKTFEYSPCGTVGLFERVDPITSRQEFYSIADSVFNLINKRIIGEYILEDFGTDYFMNWGIRRIGGNRGRAFGPVLLDYPTMFKLDGKKLFCNNVNIITGQRCTGVIDYDAGFNHLICPVCGKQYQARQLAKYEDDNSIIIANSKGEKKMEVIVKRGRDTIVECNSKASKIIEQKPKINVEVKKDNTKVETKVENTTPVNNKVEVKAEQTAEKTVDSESEKKTLKILFAKYPDVGAEILQNKFYMLDKKLFEDEGVATLDIAGCQYIRSDLNNFNKPESEEEMVKPTEKDFDDNGKLIIERTEKEEENKPFIPDSKKGRY